MSNIRLFCYCPVELLVASLTASWFMGRSSGSSLVLSLVSSFLELSSLTKNGTRSNSSISPYTMPTVNRSRNCAFVSTRSMMLCACEFAAPSASGRRVGSALGHLTYPSLSHITCWCIGPKTVSRHLSAVACTRFISGCVRWLSDVAPLTVTLRHVDRLTPGNHRRLHGESKVGFEWKSSNHRIRQFY